MRTCLETPVKPQVTAAPGTLATGGADTSQPSDSGQADDLAVRFRGLGEALIDLAVEEVKQQTATVKKTSQVRRVRLVSNLVISLVVQGFMLAWLYWEVTHLSSHSNLTPSILANFISGAYAGASTYMLGRRTENNPGTYSSQAGRAEPESVDGDDRTRNGLGL